MALRDWMLAAHVFVAVSSATIGTGTTSVAVRNRLVALPTTSSHLFAPDFVAAHSSPNADLLVTQVLQPTNNRSSEHSAMYISIAASVEYRHYSTRSTVDNVMVTLFTIEIGPPGTTAYASGQAIFRGRVRNFNGLWVASPLPAASSTTQHPLLSFNPKFRTRKGANAPNLFGEQVSPSLRGPWGLTAYIQRLVDAARMPKQSRRPEKDGRTCQGRR